MSDPRKTFVCPARRHLLNDNERPWGKESLCPYCEYESMDAFVKLIDSTFPSDKNFYRDHVVG